MGRGKRDQVANTGKPGRRGMKCATRGLSAGRAQAVRAAHPRPTAAARPLAKRSSPLSCRAARGTYNTDFASTLEYKRHDNDVGSPEYQIARLSTRIKQLTEHLKEHKTDHATRRGLMALLNRRNTLLQYLFRTDRATYTSTIQSLGIRSRLQDKI